MRRLIAVICMIAGAGCTTTQVSHEASVPRAEAPLVGVPPPLPPAQAATMAAIGRVRTLDGPLHSVIALDPTALDQAARVDSSGLRGPLAGQPVLIKDNIETAGPLPTTAGSLALANNITNRDAPLVARLRAAGAVILGKTNLSEWANIRSNNSISGWSALGGQTRNPWALDRNPCGMLVAPDAALDDGLLDVVLIAAHSKPGFLMNMPRVFKGVHVGHPAVRVLRAREVRVDADRPFTVYADGDPIGDTPLTIRVIPRAVRVLVPG